MAFTRGANVVTDGLVLYLDAANPKSYISGSTSWRDMAGSVYLGTLTNSPSASSDNYGSIVFNGTANFINSPIYPVTAPFSFYTGSFSLESTIKPTAYQTSSYFGLTNSVILKGFSANTFNYYTQLTSDTIVTFYKRGSTESLQAHSFTVPSMLNKISTITFTINPTGTTVTCYFNGSLIGSLSITGTKIGPSSNDTLLFGAISGVAPMYFTGNMYSMKIYNKTLSTEEVQQNYNALKSRFNL